MHGYRTTPTPQPLTTPTPPGRSGPPEGYKEFGLSATDPHICANTASHKFQRGPAKEADGDPLLSKSLLMLGGAASGTSIGVRQRTRPSQDNNIPWCHRAADPLQALSQAAWGGGGCFCVSQNMFVCALFIDGFGTPVALVSTSTLCLYRLSGLHTSDLLWRIKTQEVPDSKNNVTNQRCNLTAGLPLQMKPFQKTV